MPSEDFTKMNLAYNLRTNRFFRIKTENGETILEGADGADYPFLRWRGDLKLPLCKSTAIEFNGVWEFDEIYRRHNFIGDEKPYVFWVEQDGKLYCRIWDEEDTTFLLAENVEKISVIRGWKNINFWNHDQGLVVAYIKTNKKVYYRNYCKQPPADPAVWEAERQITQFSNAVDVGAFRTNDYRTGILCENEQGQISWVIAERDWAGMAVPDEHITAVPSVEIIFREIQYPKGYEEESITVAPSVEILYLFASTDNELISLINVEDENENWGKLIEFEIKNEAKTLPNVVLTNVDMGQNIPVWKVEYLEGNKYLIYISEDLESGINNITGDIKSDITGLYNEAGYEYIALSETFTPINLVPENIPLPEVCGS